MARRVHTTGAIGAALLATAALTGCGGAGTSSEPVAEVAGHVITKGTFEHWMHVAAARDYELRPRRPVPNWLLPDPPSYASCIAHVRASGGQLPNGPSTPASGSPRRLCEQRYEALREQVLGGLISGEWLISEGEARGLTVTAAAIRQRLARAWENGYRTDAEAHRDVRYAGETTADQLLRSKIKLFSEEIDKQFSSALPGSSPQPPALLKLFSELPKKWAPRTSCRPGYVVPNCRQYKGPLPPEIQLL